MGAYHAPHVTGEALKTAVFASALFEQLGFDTAPRCNDPRGDIIQLIMLGNEDKLCRFCEGIQSGSAVFPPTRLCASRMPSGCRADSTSTAASSASCWRQPRFCAVNKTYYR